jgi:hypothetical protein
VLVPYLGAAGMVTVVCEQRMNPTQAFAQAAQAACGQGLRLDERPLDFLVRLVGSTLSGRHVVFVLDDLDLALRADHDGKLAHELGDLLSRVCGRPGGKARFLFTSADVRVHLVDGLERRTGSLFPITSRYTLGRLTVAQASDALAEMLASATMHDPELPRAVAEGFADAHGVLPVDLTVATRAIRDLGLRSVADLQRQGGAAELHRRWIDAAATATGDSRRALRLLAELAEGDPLAVSPVDLLAGRAGVDPEAAVRMLQRLCERGVCVPAQSAAPEWPSFTLAHEAMAPRLRAMTAAAADGARRARALLAGAAMRGGRIGKKELAEIAREQILPATADEAAVLRRTKRFRQLAIGGIAAVPLLLLVILYVALSGHYHTAALRRGGGDRIVVRSGNPSLKAFWWLPGSWGETVADTGITPSMVPPDRWKKLASGEVRGDLGGTRDGRPAYVADMLAALHPRLSALLRYAIQPDDGALADLKKGAASAEDWLAILAGLEPIARGGAGELQVVTQALAEPSPAVQQAALAMAARVEARKPGSYRAILVDALAAADATMRRQAHGALKLLPPDRHAEIYALALAAAKDPSARKEALSAVAGQRGIPPAAAAEAAVAILGDPDAGDALQATGWRLLEEAWKAEPGSAAASAAKLLGEGDAPETIRREILRQLDERAPKDAYAGIAPAIADAAGSSDLKIRVLALPLHARLSPGDAVKMLALDANHPVDLRAAQAEGWGELARSEPAAAQAALDTLLEDKSVRVRAAAARAYGKLGRAAQDRLAALIKEGGDVGEGAAWGYASLLEAGGSANEAVAGLAKMWKAKGAQKRLAARVLARIARSKPGAVLGYLTQASRDKDDPALRPIGVDGLCAALDAGAEKGAGKGLADAAGGELADARARVASCLARGGDADVIAEVLVKRAPKLRGDGDAGTRADAARALAAAARDTKGKPPRGVAEALVELVGDSDRQVRLAALAGLTVVGNKAPAKEAAAALRAAYGRASGEEEKLAVLEAAAAVWDEGVVKLAASDASPIVRRRAMGVAVASKSEVLGTLQRGLADDDPTVRREAVLLLGSPEALVPEAEAARLLDAALRDRDPAVAEAALALLPTLTDPETAAARISLSLRAASELERTRGARAALGLAVKDPKRAAALLEPLLSDGAHDVRTAVAPALATAWSETMSADELGKKLGGAETDAMVRVTAAWALALKSRKDAIAVGRALAPIAETGPGFTRLVAQVTRGLIANEADAPGFLVLLVP